MSLTRTDQSNLALAEQMATAARAERLPQALNHPLKEHRPMSRDSVAIVSIEPVTGTAVIKSPGSNKYNPWKFDIVYVLADGRRVESTSRHSLKRDAVAELKRLPAPPDYPTTANFDDGVFTGTTTKLQIGVAR